MPNCKEFVNILNERECSSEVTYDNLDVILVAHGAAALAERNLVVAGVRRADHVLSNVRLPAVADPVPGELPGRAAPDLVRAERLQRGALVGVNTINSGRHGIDGGVQDAVRARGAEGERDELLVEGVVDGVGEPAVDRRTRLVAYGRDNDGLRDLGEGRGRVEGRGDEHVVTDGTDRLRGSSGFVELAVDRLIEKCALTVQDGAQGERTNTSRVASCAVHVVHVSVQKILVHARRQEAEVLRIWLVGDSFGIY